jgi:hypothetical protein
LQLSVSDIRVTFCCSGVICGVAQPVNTKKNNKQKVFFIVVVLLSLTGRVGGTSRKGYYVTV